MLNKKTVRDISVKSKRVLLRCDLNVPLAKDDKNKITSDKRIVESLKTINYLISAGAKVVICSHLGKTGQNLSLAPVAKRLSELLEKDVPLIKDIFSKEAKEIVKNMQPGDVVLLENTRMYEEEEQNDEKFAKKLASFGQIFVNDAFGSAHRAHASTVGVTKYLPSVAGFLIEKELNALDKGINDPVRPLVAILGGAKVSSKIGVINELLKKVDTLIIGGAMTCTFVKAMGGKVGSSLVEDDKIKVAKKVMETAKKKNVKLILPVDNIISRSDSDASDVKIAPIDDIPDGYMGVDIGPKTILLFEKELKGAKTVVWNGPLGIFEVPEFANGTMSIVNAIASMDVISIIGGGDSAAAVEKSGLEKNMTHVSTGGGASLEFLEGKTLPGIAALARKLRSKDEREKKDKK